METVTVKKDELIKLVEANREGHQAIFEEAVIGYRKEAEKVLRKHLDKVAKGSLIQVYISLPMPVNHTKDYDRVLMMLDMSVADEVTISQRDFASYAMDDWQWKREFLDTNSAYSMTAMRLSGDM